MGKYDELAKEIVDKLGGKENILKLSSCSLRIRVRIADENRIELRALKIMYGIVTVQKEQDEYQVVIGSHAPEVYQAMIHVTGLKDGGKKKRRSFWGKLWKTEIAAEETPQIEYQRYYSCNSPMEGMIESLETVDDYVFSSGALGPGIAIEPLKGVVLAPADGKVSLLPEAGHAIGFTTKEGIELYIHVGTNTVELEGQYFHTKVVKNEIVSKGKVLMEFEMDNIRKSGYSLLTPIIITNSEKWGEIRLTKEKNVRCKDALFYLGVPN